MIILDDIQQSMTNVYIYSSAFEGLLHNDE